MKALNRRLSRPYGRVQSFSSPDGAHTLFGVPFQDGKNDGPFTEEVSKGPTDADIIWKLDMMKDLGVSQHNMANSSPLVAGSLVYVETSNGQDENHEGIKTPLAPSFIAVDKNTGKVVWQDNSPGKNILHGQWSSPAVGEVGGVLQAFFPGGGRIALRL